MTESQLSTEVASLLYELRRLWHDRYKIEVSDDGAWSATRLTGSVTVTAGSLIELRPKITRDATVWNREVFSRHNS
jgi:hypothetical protein